MLRKKIIPVLLCAGMGPVGVAQATAVSYYMDQSNVANAPAIADGTANFLQVTIDDEGAAGYINFTVSVLPALGSLAGSNFGIEKFSFNVTSAGVLPSDSGCTPGPSCTDWLLPAGWSANTPPPPNQNDGFGKFDVEVSDGGTARQTTLQFSFASTNTLAMLLDPSANPAAEGNAYFAAHVAGFSTTDTSNNIVTSAYFGATDLLSVPVPAPLLLLGSALLSLIRFRKKQ